MGRPLRFVPPECELVEVTCRTLQGRLLLRPSRRLNELVCGIVARAARRYGVGVCAFVYLSNHCHLLLRPGSAPQLAAFMRYVDGNIAREAGRLYRWRERFWGRRYRDIPASHEPEAQVGRLRYLLAQGCKEGLVAKPQDWPGASSTAALLDGSEIVGTWVDRTAQYRARRRGKNAGDERFASSEVLELVPLPCWDELTPGQRQARVAELVAEIEEETRREHRRAGTRPLGVRWVLRQRPHSKPRRVERSPAPRFHAATWEIRKMLEAMYFAFRDAYRDAMESLREAGRVVAFPPGGIPPPGLQTAIAG